jgi:hypothetical protein
MITLKEGQYLSDVMDEIPSNCILSKRIPGCGATTLELNTDRNSIIVVPNIPVIVSKCNKKHSFLFFLQTLSLLFSFFGAESCFLCFIQGSPPVG